MFDLPGGRIEPGETIELVLKREFEEEVGGQVNGRKFVCVAEYMCEYTDMDGKHKSSGVYFRDKSI